MSHRGQPLPIPVMPSSEIGTNTDSINPLNTIGIMNHSLKKKHHNIIIKEPKSQTRSSHIKYSDKQNFRRYKSNVEPKLHNKIMIDEEDDMVAKIKNAFGIKDPPKDHGSNYTYVITAQAPADANDGVDPPPQVPTNFYKNKPKNGQQVIQEQAQEEKQEELQHNFGDDYQFDLMDASGINDVSREVQEELSNQVADNDGDFLRRLKAVQKIQKFHSYHKDKQLWADLQEAKFLNSIHDSKYNPEQDIQDQMRVVASPVRRGNETVGLEMSMVPNVLTPEGKKRYNTRNSAASAAETPAKVPDIPEKKKLGRPFGAKTDMSDYAVTKREFKKFNKE